jgi:outer membrane protein assembly factor BamB
MNCFPKFPALLVASLWCPLLGLSLMAQPEKIWDFSTPKPILASPAISPNGTIYIGSYDRNIYALNPDGSVQWSTNLPPPIYIYFGTYTAVYGTPAIGADGTIYVPSENGRLLALDPSDGAVKWTYSPSMIAVEGMYSSPALGTDGTIYVGSYDRNLYAIHPNGTNKWSSRFDSTIFASPAVGPDGTIYCGSDNGKFYALNPVNGSKNWTFITGAHSISASPAIAADGTIYIGVGSINNPKFYSISPQGTTNWVFTTGNRIRSSAAIGPDGTIYFGCDDGNLYALNPSGTEKWAFPAGAPIGSSPAIAADGTIYFGSDNGKLYALDSDGNERWTFQTGNYVFTSPAIGPDGTVYVASADGNLYVLRGCSPPAISDWPMFRRNAARNARAGAAVVNRPPVLDAISDQAITAGEPLTFTNSASDPDEGQQLAFSLGLGAPAGASIHPTTGLFEWTPSNAAAGIHFITVVVTDNGSPPLTDAGCFMVTVESNGNPENQAPQLDPVPGQVVDELSTLTLTITATDADEPPQTLTFSLVSPPEGAAIDPVTGVFTWTPAEAQGPGLYTITVMVSDDGVPSLSDTQSFQVEVREVNRSPVLGAIADYTVVQGTTLSILFEAADPDIPANTLAFSLDNAPSGATVDSATGVFTWTPSQEQVGTTNLITATVTDDGSPPLSDSRSFTVIVVATESLTISPIAPQTIDEGTTLGPLAFTVSDPVTAAEDLIVTASSSNTVLVPDPAIEITGAGGERFLTLTPASNQSGTTTITLTVSDGAGASQSTSFLLTVNPVNHPPVLEPVADHAVHPGVLLTFTFSATDPDGPANTLTYSLESAPEGASVDPVTGVFAWTPTQDQVGAPHLITVTVTDDGAPPLSASADFTVAVVPLAVAALVLNGNEVEITWSSIPGARYRVEYQSSLSDAEWLALPGEVEAAAESAVKTDAMSAGGIRFYRILFLPEE